MNDGKGYRIPDPINPGAYRCIQVYVPDDTLYLAAFWRSYELFASWHTWERDAAHRGKDAAAVWRIGYEMARAAWEAGEECDMPFELRENPEDPCEVQQSLDGGETWIHAFDLDCGGVGVPVPTPTENQTDGANNFVFNLWLDIVQELNTNPTREDFADWYCDQLESMGITLSGCDNLGRGFWDDWDAATELEKEALLDPCSYAPLVEEIQSCFDGAGVMDWLNCASDTLNNWLNEASDDLMQDLTQLALLLTGEQAQAAADYAGGGGGAGFGTCDPTPLGCMDFTEDPHGFVRVGGFGVWLEGVGWKAQINGDDTWECRIRKSSGFPNVVPTNVQVVYTPTGNAKRIELTINGVLVKTQLGGSAGWRQLNYTPTEAIESMEIYVSQNNLNSSLLINRVCIT